MSDLTDLIAKHGVDNVFFYGQATPIRRILGIPFSAISNVDEPYSLLFRIVEDHYEVAEDYKIGLEPMLEGFASETFYTSDLEDSVNQGRFMVLVKADAAFDQAYIEANGVNRVFFYTKAEPMTRQIGMKVGNFRSYDPLAMLFSVYLINGKVELSHPRIDVREPDITMAEMDKRHKEEGEDMILYFPQIAA